MNLEQLIENMAGLTQLEKGVVEQYVKDAVMKLVHEEYPVSQLPASQLEDIDENLREGMNENIRRAFQESYEVTEAKELSIEAQLAQRQEEFARLLEYRLSEQTQAFQEIEAELEDKLSTNDVTIRELRAQLVEQARKLVNSEMDRVSINAGRDELAQQLEAHMATIRQLRGELRDLNDDLASKKLAQRALENELEALRALSNRLEEAPPVASPLPGPDENLLARIGQLEAEKIELQRALKQIEQDQRDEQLVAAPAAAIPPSPDPRSLADELSEVELSSPQPPPSADRTTALAQQIAQLIADNDRLKQENAGLRSGNVAAPARRIETASSTSSAPVVDPAHMTRNFRAAVGEVRKSAAAEKAPLQEVTFKQFKVAFERKLNSPKKTNSTGLKDMMKLMDRLDSMGDKVDDATKFARLGAKMHEIAVSRKDSWWSKSKIIGDGRTKVADDVYKIMADPNFSLEKGQDGLKQLSEKLGLPQTEEKSGQLRPK